MSTFGFLKQPKATMFVFLGGTVDSTWRERLDKMLTVNFFNPIVPDWTPAFQDIEDKAKEAAPVQLYVITPRQTGFYAIAEMTAAALAPNGRTTVVCFLDDDEGEFFTTRQKASNKAIEKLLMGGSDVSILHSLEEVASFLNKHPELSQS